VPPTGRGEGLLLDINNDGDLEIFDENALWMDPYPTNGRSGFYLGSPKEYISSGAPASADFDNDGDLDIAVALPQGGFDIFENKFETKNNWLKVKLNAKTLNRYALGTRILVYFKDKNGEQRIIANAIGGRHGGASRSDITAHFGLGKATLIDSVTVKWSPSKRTILRGVQVNQTLTIDEIANPVRPSYPTDLQVIAATNNQFQLTWKDLANNELGYIVQRSKATADSGFITLDTLRTNTISYLTPNTAGNNFYRVFGYNASANSAFSNTAILNTPSVCGLTVAVDTFFVSPEKSITTCDSVFKISVPQVANVQYQWFYNETPLANAVSNSFTANKTGVYSLKVKNSLGCTRLLAPVKVALGFPITGKITLPNNTPSVSSLVKLFKIELNNTSVQVDATNTDANGDYQFLSKTKGNYKILAYPLNQTTVAPTYFGNTVNANVATLLNATECRTYTAPIKLIIATPTQDVLDKVFIVEVQNNPFYDKLSLNIKTTKEETLSIQLLSLSGSVLQTWTQQVDASASTMSLNPFITKGAYILKIENKEHVKQFFKIVKL
jgi:ASPIC and UnbV